VYPYDNIEELDLIVSEINEGEKLRFPIPYEQIEYIIVKNKDEARKLLLDFNGTNIAWSSVPGHQWPTILTSTQIRRDV
jgi:hypothetical protein